MTERKRPHNIEAEQGVLGSLLMTNASYDVVARLLEPKHFYEPLHQDIWTIATAMIASGQGVSPITIKDHLPQDATVGDFTLREYLVRLAGLAAMPHQIRELARTVHKLWQAREAIQALEEGIDAIYNRPAGQDVLSQVAPAEEALAKLRSESIRDQGHGAIGRRYIDNMTAARQRGEVRGVPLCLPEIGRVISEPCLEEANLYGLLSSSGEGKTSLTLQIIHHALKQGHPVQFQSFDQSAEQCVRQMVAQAHEIEARRQRAGDLSTKEWERVVDFSAWLDELPFEVVKCTDQSAPQLVGLARTFVKSCGNGKVPLIVTDHIGAVKPEDRRADEGTKAKDINKIFKAGAEQTGSAWLVLNQRNSYGMKRDNPRPISADLYGGDPAKQAYDAIFYVYRFLKFLEERRAVASTASDYKKIDTVFPSAVRNDGEDIAEIGAIKVRFGASNITERLRFEARFTRYSPLKTAAVEDQAELIGARF